MTYVAAKVAEHGLTSRRTLEVGSANVNGSVRALFDGPYVGIDREAGEGVDVVCQASELPFAEDTFAVVCSTEMLEHDSRPWRSVAEMARVLQPGGHLIVTARGYNDSGCFPVHNPPDLWRYSPEAIGELVQDAGFSVLDLRADPQVPGVFCVAAKAGSEQPPLVRCNEP